MLSGNFEQHAQRFEATVNDVPARLKFVTAMRESIEIVHTNDYESFLKYLFPSFLKSLVPPVDASPQQLSELPTTIGRCSFYENEEIHKIRNVILEILNRLPNNDALRPHAAELLRVAMAVLKSDNEENAIISLRIIFDLHKNFSTTNPALEREVQPFIDFFTGLYANLEHTLQVNFTQQFNPNFQISPQPHPFNPQPNSVYVAANFPILPAYPILPPLPAPPANSNPGRLLLRGSDSFKVLTECPLIVMLLFQMHTKYTEENVRALIPLMMKSLQAQAPPPPPLLMIPNNAFNPNQPPSSSNSQQILSPVFAQRWKSVFSDFVAAQVKSLSFLTYVLRSFNQHMLPHSDTLATCVISLLANCPPEATNSRKELLVACRHILATEFRKSFYKKLDRLLDLDDEILIGKGRQSFELLRPLAYTTLGDLVHHVRSDMSLGQLSRVVYIFSRNVHDPTLPLGIQISSVRTILNLVDHIYRTQEQQDQRGRTLLVRILWTLTNKFETLKDLIPKKLDAFIMKREVQRVADLKAAAVTAQNAANAGVGTKDEASLATAAAAAQSAANTAAASLQNSPPIQSPIGLSSTASLLSSSSVSKEDESPEESIRDIKLLLHTMVFGLKAVVWCISNFSRGQKRNQLDEEEVLIMCRLMESGLKCFKVHNPTIPGPVNASGIPSMPTIVQIPGSTDDPVRESRELLDHFASLFMVLDSKSFRDVFNMKMECLFQQIVLDAPKFNLLYFPQLVLSNVNQSQQMGAGGAAGGANAAAGPDGRPPAPASTGVNRVFADILLPFLVKRMPEMWQPPSESNASSMLLSMFRLVFNSVSENETILRPYINPVVTNALRLATQVKHPLNYFGLLRALFRAIGGGKFEQLYKEFLPLLPELLTGLMKMHANGPQSIREITIELCLTVPARLSSLLPYIPILMKAVLLALQAADEQVIKLGLRTLEFWVDNLNPDYLYPHMCPVLNDLMRSLTQLLRPQPSSFGQTALNVLGKLGGRNRRFFIENYNLNVKKDGIEEAWNIDATWMNGSETITGSSMNLNMDSTPSQPTPAASPTSLQFSLNLDAAIEVARNLLLKDHPDRYSHALTQQLHSHPAERVPLAAPINEETGLAQQITSSISSMMNAKLVQKYNAFLLLRSALISMLDMKGDLAKFRSTLPSIESAADKSERLQREREEREREAKMEADEASYSGPVQSSVHPVVTLAPAMQALPPGATPPSSTPIQQVLSRSMAPHQRADAEGPAVSARFQHEASRTMFKQLVHAMIVASADLYLKAMDVSGTAAAETCGSSAANEVESFLEGLISHMAMVAVHLPPSISELTSKQAAYVENVMIPAQPEVKSQEETTKAAAIEAEAAKEEAGNFAQAPAFEAYHLDVGLFLDALLQALSEENRYWASAAALGLRHFIASFITLVGAERAASAPVISELLSRLVHLCYEEKWEKRHAGIIGVSMLQTALPASWALANAPELIRALLFSVKDDASAFAELSAQRSMDTLRSMVAAIATLAVEEWEKRRGSAEVLKDDVEVTQPEESEVGLTSTDAAASSTSGDADAHKSGDADTSSVSLIRSESTADTSGAAGNTDIDIHMSDGDEKTEAKDTNEKKEKDTETSSSTAAAAPVDPLAPVGKNAFDEQKSPIIRQLISLLLPELWSSVSVVRDSADELLRLLAATLHRPWEAVLVPYRHKLLTPIRQKNIHSFPLAIRTGYIAATTYSLSLPHPQLPSQTLQYFAHEVLMDPPDDQNYGNAHPATRALKMQLVTKLRVESIQLMSMAICSDEMSKSTTTTMSENDVKVRREFKELAVRHFFRSLMSRSSDVVKVAKKGLKAVIDREKLPKELLQQCLRPVLLNLADTRKLSVILLEGLARLLELLSNCFNLTLGEKLLEHLRCFAEMESLQKMRYEAVQAEKQAQINGNTQLLAQLQQMRIRPEDESKIAASIIDLFHLLPQAPDTPAASTSTNPASTAQSKFLEPLIRYTLLLEELLPVLQMPGSASAAYPPSMGKDKDKEREEREKKLALDRAPAISADSGIVSPYRVPLIKFLNVNAYKSCEVFLKQWLQSTRPRQLFLAILKDPTAAPLRKCMLDHPDLLINYTFCYEETAKKLAAAHAAAIAANQAAAGTAAPTAGGAAAMDTSSSTTPAGEGAAGAAGSSSSTSSGSAGSTSTTAAGSTSTTTPATPAPFPIPGPQDLDDRTVQGVSLTLILSSFYPEFLSAKSSTSGKTVLQHLYDVWDSDARKQRLIKEENYPSNRLAYLDETKMLVEIFLNHVRVHKDDVGILWRLLEVFKLRSLTDFTFLADFYRTEVAINYTAAQKKHAIREFLKYYQQNDISEYAKTRALKLVVIPMLKASLKEAEAKNKENDVKSPADGKTHPPLDSSDFGGVSLTPFSRSRSVEAAIGGDKMQVDEGSNSPTLAPVPSTQSPPSLNGMGSSTSQPNKPPSFSANDVLDAEMVDVIIKKLLGGGSDTIGPQDEELRIELLRFSTMLIKYLHRELVGYRKELIKFAWNHLKSNRADDTIGPSSSSSSNSSKNENQLSKFWAYVNIARFIDVYESPTRIVLQVYVALLRTHQQDVSRPLVKKALDILLPALPKRLPPEGHRYATWIKWTKKIIIEEGHQMPQLIHIWNIIIRHSDLFYHARTQFVAQMVNSLNRLGLPTNRGLEQRKVAVDLAELIIQWDRKYIKESSASPKSPTKPGEEKSEESASGDEPAAKRVKTESGAAAPAGPVASSSTASASAPNGSTMIDEGRVNGVMIELITTFLVRLALTMWEHADTKPILKRCIKLLREAGELWKGTPGGEMKLVYIEKILGSVPETNALLMLYATTIDVMCILLNFHPQQFMVRAMPSIDKIISMCCKHSPMGVGTIRDGCCEMLTIITKELPLQAAIQPSEEVVRFYKNLKENIFNALKNSEKQTVSLQIALLGVILKGCPSYLDTNFPSIVKVVQKLAKDHVTRSPHAKPTSQDEKAKYYQLTDTLKRGLQIIADRIGMVGEHKKAYLSTLAHLIDKSTDISLMADITKTIAPWITSNETAAPNGALPGLPPPAIPASTSSGAAPMDTSATGAASAPAEGAAPPPPAAGSSSPSLSGLSNVAVNPPPGTILSSKEKANFVLKMCRFDRFDAPELLHRLLDIVLTCFSSKSMKSSDWLTKLQRAFMLGLRCRDLTYRDQFIALFHQHISPTVWDRLNYIFQLQDWENLSDSFWMTQATDLLLSIVKDEEEIVASNGNVNVNATTPRAVAGAVPRRYNQLVMPSFDSAYWKNGDNIDHIAKEDKQRVQTLAKQRLATNKAQAAETSADGDENMLDSVLALQPRRRAAKVNRKKRTHTKAFNADEKKLTVVVKDSTATGAAASIYTPVNFSSPPTCFAVLSNGQEDLTFLRSVLNTPDPHAYRASFMQHQSKWFLNHSSNPSSNLIEPLRDLINTSPDMTGKIWSGLFPHAWSKLNTDQRQELVNPINSLLSKDWHSRLPCDKDHLHPVQVLLESFLHCHPTPAVIPELLRFMAKTYNSWQICISLLEQRILPLGNDVPFSNNIPSYNALSYLYRELGEEDVWHGLWRRRVVSDYSHTALALEQFSMWPRAQDYLYTAMNKKHIGGEAASAEIGPVGLSETVMWEEEWVRCSRHLNQWEILKDFAHQIGHLELQWEAAWRLGDWNTLRDMCQKHSSVDIPNAKLYQISLAIHDRKSAEVLLAQAQAAAAAAGAPAPTQAPQPVDLMKMMESIVQSALREWQSLPTFVGNSHIGMLQRFQRIVEFTESSGIVNDMMSAQRNTAPQALVPPNVQNVLKNIITTWKERLLNKWEELPVWSEILTWRCHMFSIILRTYASGQETVPQYARFHDLPWTVIKLAQVARKQQLPAVCLQILSKINHFSQLDASDMFTRLREQIKTCLQSHAELNAALNILSSTNLDYFNTEQKAEMFRLKGEALQHLGYGDESNCFPVEDHEVLTADGFVGYTEFRRRVDAGEAVSVACPRQSGVLEYHSIKADRLIEKVGPHALVQIKQEITSGKVRSNVDLVVTGNHRMWVKVAAEELLDQVKEFSISRADSLVDRRDPSGSEQFAKFVGNSEHGVQRATARCLPFVQPLGLHTDAQISAFLELYGYWFANGSLEQGRVVAFNPQEQDVEFVTGLLARIGVAHQNCRITDSQWSLFFHEHYFARWVFEQLDASQLRSILRGLRMANEENDVIITSSARFRDELQTIALMAGYTCHWTRRGDQYAVVFSAEESVSQPVLSCAKEIKSVPFVAGAPHRKVWCVSVPTSEQLIVVRRVTQRHEGRIVEASRPIVMGNTAFSACLSISDTYGKGWASWAAFCDRVFTLKKDVQWADHALTCFPESDTRVLTDKGFLFLNQIEALIAAGTPPLYASYSKDRQQIDYVEGKLVFKQNPPERLVDFTQAATRSLWEASSQGTESANHMSIRVTPDHDMFVQVGSHDAHTGTFNPIACDGIEQPYAKVPAEQLASGFKCDCDNHDSCYHGRRSIRMLAQVHSGVNVEMNMDAEPVHRLGLQTTAQLNAFLQIYGLWLASGSLSTDGIVLSDVECLVGTLSASGLIEDRDWVRAASSAIVISKATWVSYFEEEYWIHEEQLRVQRESAAVGSIAARRLELAAQFGVTVSELDVDSAKWFFPWMLQSLSRAQVRLVLAGLQQSTKGSLQIATRGAHMRDEIVRACIHAGFSAVTSAGANAQEWCVSYTENASTFIETIDVRHDSSEALSPLYDPVKDGRLWCITLPASTDRLLIAQRARVGKSGVVEQASRPVIVGNCYIQAISNKFKRATLNMSRILYLLSFDSYGGPVIKAFQRFAEHIPLWVWIMWIPQLLSSLARPEGAMVKVLLSKIAKAYPQSLYYTMRAYLIELRDARQNSLQYNPPAEQPAQQASQAAAAASAAAAPVKKEGESSDSAMTDAASASASSSSASGSTTSGATTSESAAAGDANLSNTSQASFQAGTPASLAKPPAPATTSQPLRGDAEPEQAAEALANAQATNSTAVAQANASGSAAASSSSTSGSSSSTSAPAGAPAPPKPEAAAPPHPNQSIAWIEDVCNVVRVTHRSVIGEIEKMIDEFSRRFKPEPEEELLNAVYALLLKAVKHPPTPFDIVPPVLQGTVERVCKKFFVTELVASATQKRHIAFVQKYKESFERDFMPSFPVTNAQPGQSTTVPNSRFPTTCNDLIQRLKRWKTHLLFVIGCTSNVHLKLEKLSSYLIRFQSWDIEIPGQFIHDREPDALNHVVIQRFDPMVKVYHSHGFSTRRIAMIGDDGKPYYFFVQYQISHITRSDERMMQLYVLLNRLMRNYKETRKRHLVHHVPIVIPLTHRLRLAETNTGHVSFEDIYDESCHVRKVDRDAPLFIYRDAMKKIGNQNNDSTTQMAARLKVYNEITTQVVPDTILSRFIHRSIPSNDQLWTFRQQLCSQLALSGFLSYLMKIGERQLHRIALLKQNGRLINSEFYPTYNESGIIESNEPVPFRLTRNLQMALSPTLIDGLFSATIMAANSCLLTNQDILKNYMSLFIRDDLLSWNSSKSIIETDVRQRELEKLNREKVQQNTNMVLKRIHMLMPTPHQQPSAAERAAQQAAGHPVPNPANQPQPLNHKIHLLIKVATSKQKLCTMGPQWAPWF